MSESAPLSGVVSISIACGRSRRARGLGGRNRITGNSICPARCSISNKPRQTIYGLSPGGGFSFFESRSCFFKADDGSFASRHALPPRRKIQRKNHLTSYRRNTSYTLTENSRLTAIEPSQDTRTGLLEESSRGAWNDAIIPDAPLRHTLPPKGSLAILHQDNDLTKAAGPAGLIRSCS